MFHVVSYFFEKENISSSAFGSCIMPKNICVQIPVILLYIQYMYCISNCDLDNTESTSYFMLHLIRACVSTYTVINLIFQDELD